MMKIRTSLVVVIAALLSTFSCGVAGADDDLRTLNGSVVLGESAGLPEASLLTVTLEDVSRADAPAVTLAQTQIELTVRRPAIPFSLIYPAAAVTPGSRYAVRARVTNGDRLLFTTTESNPVDPLTPNAVELLLQPVPTNTATNSDVALTDTYWKLLDVDGRPVQVTDAAREPNFVLSSQGGRLAGSGGVNRLLGGYTLKGDSLVFSQVATTMMAGPPQAMQQEQAILAALDRVSGFRVVGDHLTLLDDSGQPVIEAVAVAMN